jgi:Asp-tRNA(Asn)/Glu-tRNA(Gln) amidotransferase C subunit
MAKKITDIDELIKARKDELKKLQEKKFNQKFKPIIDIFKKYQNKITDEEITKMVENIDNKYSQKNNGGNN